MAFKTAGRLAMAEGMPKCGPVLLEPILRVTVHVPSDYTPNVKRLLSGRRGQLLGSDARDGWPGWDSVQGYLPQAEMPDLNAELQIGRTSRREKDCHSGEIQGVAQTLKKK